MASAKTNRKAAVEKYFASVRRIAASGGATDEPSYYPSLVNLLDEIGETLKPKVHCVAAMSEQGSGRPDIGLYNENQKQRGVLRAGQKPERGVVEVKSADHDLMETAQSKQVRRYWRGYRLVLVTNLREFLLVGEDDNGNMTMRESCSLAGSAETFKAKLEDPHAFANEVSTRLVEYLVRVLLHRATITDPKDLAQLLASYARDSLDRVKTADDANSLEILREALEEALGIQFKDDKGLHFFHSTFVQTLFYGMFSAWVLWARQESQDKFHWRMAGWYLRVPIIQALFQRVSQPDHLHSLNLVEVLDWAADALKRVNQSEFFKLLDEGEAVQYFYEPFLEAFDSDLRKQLGAWYTPAGIVKYMVARVDRALKDDLGIAEGLAAENVYILDPCCGTGTYLVEVLRCISKNLESHGADALAGEKMKQVLMKRVFGFEIMPAPLVIAHLQVGLTMRNLGAPLKDETGKGKTRKRRERANIFLTNALTGWDPRDVEKMSMPLIPELTEERERSDKVKREEPILVILGNPPYNGYAGMAVDEERELSEAYRSVEDAPPPEGQGLNDLYVRFFRMAERRITEKRARG